MKYLNSALENGKLYLKNRLIMPPMATAKADLDGQINTDVLKYYDEKSKGGFLSLIIIEHSFVAQQGKAKDRQISVAEDSMIEGLTLLADTIHKNGSKTVMQLNHAGSATGSSITGTEAVGPSAVINPSNRIGIPEELTKEGIQEIIKAFKNAALRVKKAGFDGVEIHSAHGYLLNQFLSPLTNKRTDEYGGDVKARIRIHVEVIEAIRSVVGPEFPILLRLGATDNMEGGLTIEEAQTAAEVFEKAGVDILDISGGLCRYILPGVTTQGYFSTYSKAIKEVISIPVIVTGGITEVKAAEEILRQEKADLIGVGRALYADSDWARKAMTTL